MTVQRVALITGGSRGIGLATALRFLGQGYAVVVTDVSERALESARAQLAASSHPFMAIRSSVTERAEMEAAVQSALDQWGRLDVLVNNAAVNRPGGLFEQTDADWEATLQVNLTGPFIATSVAAAAIRDSGRGGAIVNIGSVGAAGFGASPAYAASKAGLIGLTRQSAIELGPFGITVNLVAPGVTRTEWVERNLGEERIAASAASNPMRRAGTTEDIAAMVTFLASPEARHTTGQVISVSGGMWMP